MISLKTTNRAIYFFVMFCILLGIVILAFTPTFYLRSQFPQPEVLQMERLPNTFIIHGIILTVWYIFLVLQAGMIQFKKAHWHRKLGWLGAVFAVLVLISTAIVVTNFPGRMAALSYDLEIPIETLEPGLPLLIWLDIFMSVLFAAFVTIAILKRNSIEIHKRLMLYAGIVYIFAATGRIGGIISHLSKQDVGIVVDILLLLSLTSSLLFFDYFSRKRILPVSWLCFILYWVAVVLSILISGTEFGKEVVFFG